MQRIIWQVWDSGHLKVQVLPEHCGYSWNIVPHFICQILFQIGGCIECFVFVGEVASKMYWWSPSGTGGLSGKSTTILSHMCMCLVSFRAACLVGFHLLRLTFLLQSPCTLSAHTPPHCPLLSLLRARDVLDRWWLPLLPETTQIRRQV